MTLCTRTDTTIRIEVIDEALAFLPLHKKLCVLKYHVYAIKE